jgi:hypothetical protein
MAGENPFIGKSVPSEVQAELTARSGASGTIWTAQRFPWISVISMCEQCTNYELSNGGSKSNKDSRYTTRYQRPNPTITQLQVRKQGELGTTRKATVSITAYDDLQLIELQQCFFIPGMSVRVQWGWSLSATGKKLPEIYKDRSASDSVAFCKMSSIAEVYPQYEGLQGLVTTFNYTLTQDGYWDCSIDIISAADATLETKTSYQCCDCPASTEENEEGTPKTVNERKSLLYSLLRLISFPATGTVLNNIRTQTENLKKSMDLLGKKPYISQLRYEGVDRTSAGAAQTSIKSMIANMFNYSTEETYMTWETLEGMVNLYCFPSKKDQSPVIGRVVSTEIKLKAPDYIESTDPRVCLLPGSIKFAEIIDSEDSLIAFGTKTLKGYEFEYGVSPKAVNKDSNSNTYVYLKDILLNCVMLMSELDAVEQSDGSLGTFLSNVLRKISDVCGGIWDFGIVSSTEGCKDPTAAVPTLTVIERKDAEKETPYLIPAMPSSTVVREIKLDLKMTEAMKSQALYSNAPIDNSNNCSKNTTCGSVAFQPFKLAKVKTGVGDVGFTNMAYPPADQIQAPPCDCETKGSKPTPPKEIFDNSMVEMIDVVNDTTTTAAANALTKLISSDVALDSNYLCSSIILPFNFEFTVDGIGGFKFGQNVSSTRIPSSLRENYVWRITAVEHTMNIQDWTTTVKTVAIFSPKKSTSTFQLPNPATPEKLKNEVAKSYISDPTSNPIANAVPSQAQIQETLRQQVIAPTGPSPVDFDQEPNQ